MHASLSDHLLGWYRNGIHTEIFLTPGISVNWTGVRNHEFTHLVLGTSTNAGILYQALSYLAFWADSPWQMQWRELYARAVSLSTVTHESAATFAGLCDDAH